MILKIEEAHYVLVAVAYSEPCQAFKMELFTKIADDRQPLTIF